MEILKSMKSLLDEPSNQLADHHEIARIDRAFREAASSLSDEDLAEYVQDALSWLDNHSLQQGRPLRLQAKRLWKEVPGVDGTTALSQAADATIREAATRLANQTLSTPIYR